MKRRLLALISLSFLATACPGEKPPVTPQAHQEAPKGPLVWHLSKSGLGFRISNADEEADKPVQRKITPAASLAAEDIKKIAARMPKLVADPDDFQDFAMRPKSLPAPRPGQTVKEQFPPPADVANNVEVKPGPFVVERHAPEGPVDLAPYMTMTFSQPMVPITSMDDLAQTAPPATISPQPPGKWRWLGTRTLMFQPDKRFPMSTEYTVDVQSGTKAMNGQTLAKAEHFTFTTPTLTMKRGYPTSGSEKRDPMMYVEFDQAIDPQKMLKSLQLAGGSAAPTPIRLAEPDEIEADDVVRRLSSQAEKGRWIAFKATDKLPVATGFQVKVKTGAPSAEGPRTTAKDQSYSFSTYGALRVNSAKCGDWRDRCTPLDPFEVSFSNAIDMKKFDKKMVSISPEIPGMKLEVHGNWMYIRGRTKGRTKYTLSIASEIGDVHGQTMSQPYTTTIDVGPADPALFDAEKDMVVLDPASPKAYTAFSINEPGIRARIFQVGPEDWTKYVEWRGEWERPRKLKTPGKLVFDKVVNPKKLADELVATPIDLAPALSGGFGQAIVVLEPTRAMPKDTWRPEVSVWVQATELAIDGLADQEGVTGWVTALKDGTPVSGADVRLLNGGAGTSDKDGLSRVAGSTKSERDVLVAKKGKDVAILPEHYYGQTFRIGHGGESDRWFMFDDRGMYKPGEEVRVKGFVRRLSWEKGGDVTLPADLGNRSGTFLVRDGRYAEIGKGEFKLDEHGTFDVSFKLPNNANLGNGYLELHPSWESSQTHSFQIQEFRRPEFEVSAKSSEGPHFVGENAIATLSATYYSGGGLPDAPVVWNITRSTGSFTPPNRSDYHFGPSVDHFWNWHQSAKEAPKSETWNSHTNPAGVHRVRLDFDALEPSYPMSLALTASVEDVNRQQWAGRTSMLVHPSDRYVGLRLAKRFTRAGENIDVDAIVSDLDGKLISDSTIVVKAARTEWEQEGTDWVEKELDASTCEIKSKVESVRCALPTKEGGEYKVWAVVTDAHGRKNQTATSIYVMGNDAPKNRSLDAGRASVVPDKKEYKPGEIAEVLVLSPFAPAEGVLTVRRQGIVHIERFSMKSNSMAMKVKLEDAYVPNVEFGVSLVGADTRANQKGDPDPSLPKVPAYAMGTSGVHVSPTGRTLDVKAAAQKPTLEPGGATNIDVDVKEPGGKAAGGADVALIVVDESVLALSGYKTPDPVAFFYSDRSAGVSALTVRDSILLADPDVAKLHASEGQQMQGRGGLGGIGGGSARGYGVGAASPAPMAPAKVAMPKGQPMDREESGKDDKNAADEPSPAMEKKKEATLDNKPSTKTATVSDATTAIAVRSNFAALALFSPKVKTDGKGHATIPLKLPDNLTRYRVMAVAAYGDKMFGSNESTVTARLPIMVRPSAPRFLNFGDKFELPIVVQNQTDQPADVGIVLRASNVTIDGETGKRVKIAANDRVEVRFNVSAAKVGTARFQIGIASGNFADASQIELPVWTPATTEAFATYGEIDEGAIAQPVKMPPNVFPQFGGLEITTSSTQLQALTDAVVYLVKYPYECNEQLASRVVSIAALKDVLTAFKAQGLPPPETLLASMTSDFEKLKRRQHWDGGWGFWQETPWPYLTVHVTHALVRAKEKGWKPDDSMMNRAHSYLKQIESKYPWYYSPETRRAITAYALYVRKRMGDPDAARARKLIAEAGGADKMPIEALGWLWPTISEDKASTAENEAIRRHISNRATETAGAAHFTTSYADQDYVLLASDRRADGVLLEAMIGDQPQSSLIPKLVKGLLDHRKAGHWTNTQENAFVLLALDRYFNTYEKVTPDFVARVWLGDKFAGDHTFKGRTTERSFIGIPMNWLNTELKAPQNLTLAKDGPGRLYYRIGMQYAPTDLRLPPADHGFIVSRTYEGADDPADVKRDQDGTWRVKAGAKVRVRVSMVNQARRYHVALVDPIPAGLEALNPALAVTGEIPKDPKANEGSKNRYWYWSRTWYEHQNMRDERVEAFASLLWEGVWDYTYVAKATTPGVFVVPPPKAEEMYAPETFGRGRGDRMIIE